MSDTRFSFEEYVSHDALGLAELALQREVSAEELLETAIMRTAAVNPRINAVSQELFDHARAKLAQGLSSGPFSGVPFLLKDLGMDLQGTPTTNASLFFKDNVAKANSEVVDLYEKAGLVIFGKTAVSEFGTSGFIESALYATTRNPWNLDYGPGGSSGGAAAAVAAGIVPMANGTDYGGSIRSPASCCGLFGMKPTNGRVSIFPDISSTNTVHAITRSVRDSAALLDVSCAASFASQWPPHQAAGSYLEQVKQSPGKLRIALVRRPFYRLSSVEVPVHPECLKAVDMTARLCESLGHIVEEASPNLPDFDFFSGVFLAEFFFQVGLREKELGRRVRPDEVEARNYAILEKGREVTAEQYLEGKKSMLMLRKIMHEFHKKYDVILSPTQAVLPPPFSIEKATRPDEINVALAAFTSIYNHTGQPAMSVPLHWTDDGLPVGLMFAGRFGDEATLYRLAGQLEMEKPWFDKMPKITGR